MDNRYSPLANRAKKCYNIMSRNRYKSFNYSGGKNVTNASGTPAPRSRITNHPTPYDRTPDNPTTRRTYAERTTSHNLPPHKRYANSLIRHFVLVALFFPAFFTKFQHVYYQDMSFMSIIALMLTINILFKWRLDLSKHKYSVIILTATLALYIATAVTNYRRYPVMFWRTEPLNILIAVGFFISLLLVRQDTEYISDRFIRFTMGAMLVHNIIGIIYRLFGGAKFYMQTFYYEALQIDEAGGIFSWMYYDAAEYALILLLTMAFFMTYKRMFKNPLLYWSSQGVFILCMLLTNVSIYYLATALLFGFDFLYSAVNKRITLSNPDNAQADSHTRLQEYLPYTYPIAALLYGAVIILCLRLSETLSTKPAIWKGAWDLLQETPEGFYVGFGVLTYTVPDVDMPVIQAQNTFLNHMLRHSLGTGIAYALLIGSILILAFIKKPNYRSLGILLAVLLPLNLDFGLQTLHLPYVLFLIYCIFFRQGEKKHAL